MQRDEARDVGGLRRRDVKWSSRKAGESSDEEDAVGLSVSMKGHRRMERIHASARLDGVPGNEHREGRRWG